MAPVLAGRALLRFGPPAVGIGLLLAAWQVAHWHYGSFILPSPWQTALAVWATWATWASASGWAALGVTFGAWPVGLIGGGLGLLAGFFWFARATFAPVATISHSFDGRCALDTVSLVIRPGELVALLPEDMDKLPGQLSGGLRARGDCPRAGGGTRLPDP